MSINYHAPQVHLSGPEGPLVEISRRVVEVLPPNPEDQRRKLATTWLAELDEKVRGWNKDFIALLMSYPGFEEGSTPAAYKAFFDELLVYQRGLDARDDAVKTNLCKPLIHLYRRFPIDFDWLRKKDSQAYDDLYRLVGDAYRNELGIIDQASRVIDRILRHDAPGRSLLPEQRIASADFLRWHQENPQKVVEVIRAYDTETGEAERALRDISEKADLQFVPIEEFENRRRPGTFADGTLTRITEMSNRPQIQHEKLYTILAFAFGITFVTALLTIALYFPDPTPFQLRVFTAVLAIAVAGCSTVMTGLLNVKATLGTQIVIGASGALATFVIIYLVKPAVL
ncbi:hypothetical protein [Bradyrhizobium arachidis]|uniref:hypothetical protein n=1 Tax=Bradyrhizobium arachidis TaxID=858423 RepID=UPI0021627D9F|nr:hypothetical protein [Bradyrhizobium arachidis]UVO30740.1 hypothetical protein KUF59_08840 [Bradyrhizobium arachidis]